MVSAAEKFGKRLKALRLAKGLSMKALATKAGVPATTYREWEYGRAIKGEPYLKLAEALEVSVHQLLAGEPRDKSRLVIAIANAEQAIEKLKMELRSFL